MLIGIYGLIFEFANPGSIGPGVIGAICLLLGLYALNQLPLDYAGLGLMLLGVALMAAEAVTPTFGVLGVGGPVAFLLGAIFLIDSQSPQLQLSWWRSEEHTSELQSLMRISYAVLRLKKIHPTVNAHAYPLAPNTHHNNNRQQT